MAVGGTQYGASTPKLSSTSEPHEAVMQALATVLVQLDDVEERGRRILDRLRQGNRPVTNEDEASPREDYSELPIDDLLRRISARVAGLGESVYETHEALFG